jgi:hypothetical protein
MFLSLFLSLRSLCFLGCSSQQQQQEIKTQPRNYDVWFDYVRLEEANGDPARVRETYERAIGNVPLEKVAALSVPHCVFLRLSLACLLCLLLSGYVANDAAAGEASLASLHVPVGELRLVRGA